MPRNGENPGSGTQRCKTDLGLILDNLAKDIEFGGNYFTITAIKSYLGANDEIQHIRLQLLQSLYAHTRLGYYMKQAINGDLDETNTDQIIISDWGITNDPGGCANVQTAIDTLIDLANDTLAPTGHRFRDAGDLLYFNKDFIADEALGILDNDFSFFLAGVTQTGFTYPDGVNGRNRCKVDIGLILDSVITDLLTGGNSNMIRAIEYYVTSNGGIEFVEDQLLATIYAFEQVKFLGTKAINNLLVSDPGAILGPDDYSPVYTQEESYRDLTITDSNGDAQYTDADCANVITAYETLWDLIIDTLTPSDVQGRTSGRMALFNKQYYLDEISYQVNQQWGAGSWIYDDFIETVVDDVVHDLAITDTSSDNVLTTAQAINYYVQSGYGEFQVGDTVTCSVNGNPVATGLVLEAYSGSYPVPYREIIIGNITGTWTTANARITGSSVTYPGGAYFLNNGPNAGGLSATFDYYNDIANIQTLNTARNITSTIEGQIAGPNLWTNPEALNFSWSRYLVGDIPNYVFSPDGLQNAEVYYSFTNFGQHLVYRDYALTAFETWDSGVTRFDNGTETFDTGAAEGTQQFTFSVFIKRYGTNNFARLGFNIDYFTHTAFFDINLLDGTVGNVFNSYAIQVDDFGAIPAGNDWYRIYFTITIGKGFGNLRAEIWTRNYLGSLFYAGNSNSGMILWGAKLAQGPLDPYASQGGNTYYSDQEYNIKTFALDSLEQYMTNALTETLVNPTQGGAFAYTNSALSAQYSANASKVVFRELIDIIKNQLADDASYTNLTSISGISVPSKTYGTRNIPVPLGGGLIQSDFLYALRSDTFAEINNVTLNEGKVAKVFKRFRIEGEITDGPFTMGETVSKQGAPTTTGVVYGSFEDENFSYLDVEVTGGTWGLLDTIVGADNGTTAQIGNIEDRLQITTLTGDFEENITWLGYTSEETGQTLEFIKATAAVTSNVGGRLTVDTETLEGSFETTSVVYPEESVSYIDVAQYAGLDAAIGNRISSLGYTRLTISYIGNFQVFTAGQRLYKVLNGVKDLNTYATIIEVDTNNNYLYINIISGTMTNSDIVAQYDAIGTTIEGYASVSAKIDIAGAGGARIQDIRTAGIYKRLYLTEVSGVINRRDAIKSINGYEASVFAQEELKARVKRSFRGFDGVQTTFDLSTGNGTPYFPDPEGHMLIFVNGILQPPGAANAYTAFSNQIQFTEPPSLGAAFTGFYVGKLRQLDDISFDFDSLRQSFNLKRNGVFYSLTLTEGVQSTTIRPENNIIVSLNGVIQEPGVGFEVVGSRIIFSEIPRVGSTFVAFSYVGSEADVDAAEVVPPIEPGDLLQIDGETEDREVAVIESSNSLITFDYLGSVFGKDANASAVLTSGLLDRVFVTAPGSGYTSRPNVRIDSISGFDAQIKALVGVGGVVVSNAGSGYQETAIAVETTVEDDWVAPNLDDYGAEVIDPEIIQ